MKINYAAILLTIMIAKRVYTPIFAIAENLFLG